MQRWRYRWSLFRGVQPVWLPRCLFLLVVSAAFGLMAVVLLAPVLDSGSEEIDGWLRVVVTFSRDVTLRRTTMASSLGLIVTACIFFKAPSKPWRKPPKQERTTQPKDFAGA